MTISASTSRSATTSRIGRKPVEIPAGVEVKIENGTMSVKGPKGSLQLTLHRFASVSIVDKHIEVRLNTDSGEVITGLNSKTNSAIAGTTRANIANAVKGVTQGFERRLNLVGVGYRAQAKGHILSLSLGYSHPTEYAVPAGLTIKTPTQTEIVIEGISKDSVGKAAADIRSMRSPEPYKGKGVRYSDEIVQIKETKKK